MKDILYFTIDAMIIGVGATVIMDFGSLLQKYLFGVPSLNYGMVGRWIGRMRYGHFMHENISKAAVVQGEKLLGWSIHYFIGILFAGIALAVLGGSWLSDPTFLPALAVGIVTVIAPYFILQPGIGAGIAASKTPNPNIARMRSVIAHCTFGLGLYVSAGLWALINPFTS